MRHRETSAPPSSAPDGARVNGADGPRTPMTPLAREALDWVVHISSGAATVRDATTLAAWRASSAEHETAFREAVRVRSGLQSMLEAREAERREADRVIEFRPRHGLVSRRAFVMGGAIAASVAGAVMVARPPLDLWPSYAELMADYRTAPGERRTIGPVAGVSIEMNTRTSIGKRWDGDGIDLISGEAFVTIARDAAFTAVADGGVVTASKAEFNLRNIDGQVCVTCMAGQVTVASGDARADLSAGHQLIYSAHGFGAVEQTNESTATGWRSGLLIFKGEPLSQVVAEINRYRAGRIVLTDGSLARHPVSAVFHLDQMANAVTQVEQLLGVRGTHLPGGVVLIG